jgi:hypothetical protein
MLSVYTEHRFLFILLNVIVLNLAMLSVVAPLYYAKACQPLIISKIKLSFAVICSNDI